MLFALNLLYADNVYYGKVKECLKKTSSGHQAFKAVSCQTQQRFCTQIYLGFPSVLLRFPYCCFLSKSSASFSDDSAMSLTRLYNRTWKGSASHYTSLLRCNFPAFCLRIFRSSHCQNNSTFVNILS